MKSLFKIKIWWSHRSNDPTSTAGQSQQTSGPPTASSPSGTVPATALSVSTPASSSPPPTVATLTGAAAAVVAGAGEEDYISSSEDF
ncbi:hypothetical protein Zm00014a_042959 [Zea mays]|jgi:hypothetical protein|uniref:Uncharacterized protein n=1 Tax=Zea mays TaxID=4577 RepID=A0A3L6F5T3_MAIZE|nr:hypothetical protein Zm00014a_042959 [Zea mays]